jgi:hypothetical protein
MIPLHLSHQHIHPHPLPHHMVLFILLIPLHMSQFHHIPILLLPLHMCLNLNPCMILLLLLLLLLLFLLNMSKPPSMSNPPHYPLPASMMHVHPASTFCTFGRDLRGLSFGFHKACFKVVFYVFENLECNVCVRIKM